MTQSNLAASIYLSESTREWKYGKAKNITFIVTENCNLSCKYCYLVGKNTNKRLSFDTAKKAVDYILANPDLFPEEAVIFDFLGGEPFLEIELIDRLTDYIKRRLFLLDHKWFNNYRLNFSTNGTLYHHEAVQRYVLKNLGHIDVTFSLDGTKRKHDLQRIYPNGAGSYDDVVRNLGLWKSQIRAVGVKSTIGHEDLPYIRESVIHLWELGIRIVNMNCVFEDVWKEGDDQILYQQLVELADYLLEEERYMDHFCSFFNKDIGGPVRDLNNWCGAGKMLAVDTSGDFYPCIRFLPYALSDKPARKIGDIATGIDQNKIRPFLTLDLPLQSQPECIECPDARGCAWCQAYNYEAAASDTIFERAIFSCRMHKARVAANKYFWDKIQLKTAGHEA